MSHQTRMSHIEGDTKKTSQLVSEDIRRDIANNKIHEEKEMRMLDERLRSTVNNEYTKRDIRMVN